jgi:protein involved in polysaccharide export with SLBB domain
VNLRHPLQITESIPQEPGRRVSARAPFLLFRGVALVTLLFAAASLATAQGLDKQSGNDRLRDKSVLPEALQRKDADLLKANSVPMEGPVDAASYQLGPSDQLLIGVWGPVSFTYPSAVTPEGTVVIPTVGEVLVTGKSLLEGKKAVVDAIRKRYPLGEITVTLTQPRSFIVTLRGAVLAPGQYIATSTDRVERILSQGTTWKVSPPTTSVQPKPVEPLFKQEEVALPKFAISPEAYEQASTRNVTLIRRNGQRLRIDIPKFYATGNSIYNPFLLDGDIISVPQKNLPNNFVSIMGAVNAPGRYEFAEGDRLSDLILLAQNLRTDAGDRVILSRLDEQGRASGDQIISAREALAGTADVPLQRMDRVSIPAKSDLRGDYRVTVAGEVHMPGEYPIAHAGTRISTVLQASGGVTVDALPAGSVVFRRADKLDRMIGEKYNLLRNARGAQYNLVDSTYYFRALLIGLEPVNVDLHRLLALHDSSQDLLLQDGDMVYIATDRHTVLVSGQVASPGHQPFTPGTTMEEYIRRAGGFNEIAERGETRIIKAGTLTWVEGDDTKIESGDQIIVPKHIPKDLSFYLGVVRDVASFTTAIATTALLFYQIQLNNK